MDPHTLSLDRLQDARTALRLAEVSGYPEGTAYAQWRLDTLHAGFCFSRDIAAARVSFGAHGTLTSGYQ